jgi:uncharacterized protein (DUF305 family)
MPALKRPLMALPAALVVIALVAAGCGGDDGSSGGSAEADFNGTDVSFAAMMVPHHEHGVEMAELAVEKASEPKVRDLAERIAATQEEEIGELKGYLDTFGEKPAMPPPAAMTLMEDGAAKLEMASGAEFDRMFLEMMSAHHASAVQMAQMEIAGGGFADAKQLAESISTTQLEEISEMRGLMGVIG